MLWLWMRMKKASEKIETHAKRDTGRGVRYEGLCLSLIEYSNKQIFTRQHERYHYNYYYYLYSTCSFAMICMVL